MRNPLRWWVRVKVYPQFLWVLEVQTLCLFKAVSRLSTPTSHEYSWGWRGDATFVQVASCERWMTAGLLEKWWSCLPNFTKTARKPVLWSRENTISTLYVTSMYKQTEAVLLAATEDLMTQLWWLILNLQLQSSRISFMVWWGAVKHF